MLCRSQCDPRAREPHAQTCGGKACEQLNGDVEQGQDSQKMDRPQREEWGGPLGQDVNDRGASCQLPGNRKAEAGAVGAETEGSVLVSQESRTIFCI